MTEGVFGSVRRRLILRFLGRQWRDHPLRSLLAAGGIALGVAVMIAVRLANASAIEAFARTMEMVSGRADVEIYAVGEGVIPPDPFAAFTRMDGIASAAPVFTLAGVAGEEQRRVRLLGVDLARDREIRPWYSAELGDPSDPLSLFTTPDGVLMTKPLARELGVADGERFAFRHSGRLDSLLLLGTLEGEDVAKAKTRDIIVMDLPRAWQLAGVEPRLSRIDLLLDPEIEPEKALAALNEWLPGGLRAELSGWRRPQARKMLSSFQLNLTALAFVALLVAGFLVYQTVNTTALQRRRDAAVLRGIGAPRRFVRDLFLYEGAALGIAGSLLGVPLGLLLARGATKAVSRTVESVYLIETAETLYITPLPILLALLTGVAVSLVSVLPVALETARIPPRESLSAQASEDRLSPRVRALIGLGIFTVGAILALMPLQQHPVLSGYIASACFIFATALVLPWLLGVLHRLFSLILVPVFGTPMRLALDVLVRSRHRITPAIAALATAVAMWLSVDMMVRSFRGTVETWVTGTVTADLILIGGDSFGVGREELLPLDLFRRLQDAEGIADVDHFRSVRVPIAELPTVVAMVDMISVRKQDRLSYLSIASDSEHPTEPLIEGRDACFISEPLAFRGDLAPGDTLLLPTPSGEKRLRIQAVFHDYSSDAGMVLLHRPWFVDHWRDDRLESIAVYLPENTSLAAGRAAVRRAVGERYQYEIYSNRELRESVLRVFDNTFAITYALEAVAILVALLAVSGGMATLVSERGRELSVLRAVGASRRQLMGRVLAESGIIGIIGGGAGIGLGVLLSYVLTYVVNRYSFGWTLQLQWPWDQMVLALLLMPLAAVAAGLPPARRAAKTPIARGVRMEGQE